MLGAASVTPASLNAALAPTSLASTTRSAVVGGGGSDGGSGGGGVTSPPASKFKAGFTPDFFKDGQPLYTDFGKVSDVMWRDMTSSDVA
jgi:hypothetical protein